MANEFPKNKIEIPTVGRVVYAYNRESSTPEIPNAAFVADVGIDGDPLVINVACLQHSGAFVPGGLQSVPHASDPRSSQFYWDWMPYQKSQAAKTEELQRQLEQSRALMDLQKPGGVERALSCDEQQAENVRRTDAMLADPRNRP